MRRLGILKDRALMLQKCRAFFQERNILETDCPIITNAASIDAHIDLIHAVDPVGKERYLHSSPEYGMKRLLAEGIGDIYQLSHVFRQGECGTRHNPEFMMAEWYRLKVSFSEMIDETLDFVRLFVGDLPSTVISYSEAFRIFTGIDSDAADKFDLVTYIREKGIPGYSSIEEEDKDQLLNLILAEEIEPKLGKESLCVLAYYPASQAALARKISLNEGAAAERFEIYYKGLELANGYHELADPVEQRLRLEEANRLRIKEGKTPLPIDEKFIQSLEKGLPDCCGVAVGFDRLMMLRHDCSDICEVIPFGWLEA